MDRERLRTIIEAYGAEPARWPADERGAAEALLARTPDLRELQRAELALDAALDSVPAQAPSSALLGAVLREAPAAPMPLLDRVSVLLERWLARPAAAMTVAAVIAMAGLGTGYAIPQSAAVAAVTDLGTGDVNELILPSIDLAGL